MTDGAEGEIGPGDIASIAPGTTPGWWARSPASPSTSAVTPSARRA